jgi:hypothetical protein
MHSAPAKHEGCTDATSLLTELAHVNEKAPPKRGFLGIDLVVEPMRLISADAPNATSDLHQGSHDGGAGEEPGESGAAATAEPEAAGELSPAGLGE